MPGLRALALLGAAAALLASPARATQTDPALAISAASAVARPVGTLVQLDGEFPQADLVQQAVPLQVLVRSGAAYVRFEMGAVPVAGTDPSLADGLDAGDVAALLDAGAPIPDARLLHLGPQRLELLLPPGFPVAGAEAQLFLVYEGDPLLSNPAPLESVP